MKYSELEEKDFTLVASDGMIVLTQLELVNKQGAEIAIFCEEDGSYCCLLPASSIELKLPEINGLVLQYQTHRLTGKIEDQNFILLKCKTKGYFLNFIQILKEILNQFDNSDLNLSDCLLIVIAKWRHFLSAPKTNILNEDEIIGLIGELIFLERVLKDVNVVLIENWTADRGEEDFIFKHIIVEVKTTQKEKHSHFINGIDQLLIDSSKKKYILSILLAKIGVGDLYSLPIIISEIDLILKDYPHLLDVFYEKLKARNYDQRDSLYYQDYSYYMNKGGLFEVNDNFPKLTTNELKQPLNSRVSKVSYRVDMEGLPNINLLSMDFKNILNYES